MGQKKEYETVIGLEVHVELATHSKIFCGCPTEFGAEPNTQVCPVCLGLPGSLPVLNIESLHLAIRAALALNCRIAERMKFDRKNYFYPDLPKAYQISQYDMPVAIEGKLAIDIPGGEKWIGITRIHLEEDAGKLVHYSQSGQIGAAASSMVDYNRTGVPLIEIVSEPDMRAAEEAYAYLTALKEILRYIQVSDCNLEEGSLRCDANISMRPQGQSSLGTKVELKNMNSFKNVRAAIEYESRRQIRVLEEGGKVVQETRLWDADKAISHSMRSKEEAHDYRYFPEPDLPVVFLSEEIIKGQKENIPILPKAKREGYINIAKISDYGASIITSSPLLSKIFDASLAPKYVNQKDSGHNIPEYEFWDEIQQCPAYLPNAIQNWLIGDYLASLKENKIDVNDIDIFNKLPIRPQSLRSLAELTGSGEISSKIGKQVFAEMISSGREPDEIIKQKGLSQISDAEVISKIIDDVIAANPNPVAEYKNGKTQTIGFLVGKVMQISKGQVNPELANQILRERLSEKNTEQNTGRD